MKYGIKYILEPSVILYFKEVECGHCVYTNDIRSACDFCSREKALEFIHILRSEYNDKLINSEVFKFVIGD